MQCTCDNGKIHVNATTWKSNGEVVKEPEVIIDCVWCNGTGTLTDAQAKEIQTLKDAWCSCGNPSKQVEFYSHGHAHGYDCADCGKILQTG